VSSKGVEHERRARCAQMSPMVFTLRAEGLDYAGRAPVVVEEVVELDAPIDRVWAAIYDTSAWEQWFVGMRSCRYTSPEPIGAGSKRSVRVATLKVDETMLAVDPPSRYAFRIDTANVPLFAALIEIVDLEPLADGARTRVRYRQCFELRGWAKPLAKVLVPQVAKGLRRGLAGLAGHVAAHP
jgi:uncharacterized protein YndB with AHSA1/START domain